MKNSKPPWKHVFTQKDFYSLVYIKDEFLYKVRTILGNKLHNYIFSIQNIWFKTKITGSTDRRKASFPKETIENADLHEAVLNKAMTRKE